MASTGVDCNCGLAPASTAYSGKKRRRRKIGFHQSTISPLPGTAFLHLGTSAQIPNVHKNRCVYSTVAAAQLSDSLPPIRGFRLRDFPLFPPISGQLHLGKHLTLTRVSVLCQPQAVQKAITQQSEGVLWAPGSCFPVNETVPSPESQQLKPAPDRRANMLT